MGGLQVCGFDTAGVRLFSLTTTAIILSLMIINYI
jgi:hypothetical protein